MGKIDKFADILTLLTTSQNPPQLSKADIVFLAQLSSWDIAIVQQNMIARGIGPALLWQVWQNNKALLPDLNAKLRLELPTSHILLRVLAEHEMILCFITDLDQLNSRIQKISFASSFTQEIRMLANIAEHLVFSDQHIQREQEIIFPELKNKGYHGLLTVIIKQHMEIMRANHMLKSLIWHIDEIDFDYFKGQLDEFVNYLVPTMQMHIFIETNIVFPLSLEIINKSSTWERMKELCDMVGYCDSDARFI